MKHIALLYDYSVQSMTAIQFAIDLFGTRNIKYVLMHAMNSRFKCVDVDHDLYQYQKDQTIFGLAKYKQFLEYTYGKKKINLETLCASEDIVPMVENVINNNDFKLLVMGSKGFSQNRNLVFGRNCQAILSNANVPVLTVPDEIQLSENINVGVVPDESMSEVNQMSLISSILPAWKCAYTRMNNGNYMFKMENISERPFLHIKSEENEGLNDKQLLVTNYKNSSGLNSIQIPTFSLQKPTLYIPGKMYA